MINTKNLNNNKKMGLTPQQRKEKLRPLEKSMKITSKQKVK